MPEVQVGLVALDGQHVVGVGGPQVLPDGPLAAGGVHGDNGSLQDHALKQAGHGCACVALGLARFLDQGQPLPHQEDTDQEQVPSRSRRAAFMAVSGSS